MESKVLRPMTIGCPEVLFLKNLRSSGRCHGSPPSFPITRSGVMATMAVSFIWRLLL